MTLLGTLKLASASTVWAEGRPLVIPARAAREPAPLPAGFEAPPDGPIGPEEMFRGAMAQPMRRSLPASSSQQLGTEGAASAALAGT